MSASRVPRVARAIRTPPLIWVVLLVVAAAVVMPAITSWEQVTFTVAGAEMNLRVATYFTVGAGAALVALPIVMHMERRPVWLGLMMALVGWFTLAAFASHQPPVEWLPTIVRLVLYFSAAVICYRFAETRAGAEEVRDLARLLPLAVLAAAAIPTAAGLAEFARGSAPILNGAPRVSGSMPTHPVAFSLVLVVSAIATMGPAFILGRRWGAVFRWVGIAVLTALVFTTFTRLSIVLLVVSGVVVAALLPATRRVRLTRVIGALVVGAAVVLLAQPTFEARFTYAAPLSGVISRTSPSPAPKSSSAPISSPAPSSSPGVGGDGWDIDVDGSIAYRILLTQRGLGYLWQSPILGHGPGSFDRLFEADSGRAHVAAHDDFLSVAVETGLPGLALYLLTLASLAWGMWPRRSTGVVEADALIVTALVVLGAIDVGAVIHNPTYFVEIQLPIWILVGTALGLRARARSGLSTGAVAEP